MMFVHKKNYIFAVATNYVGKTMVKRCTYNFKY